MRLHCAHNYTQSVLTTVLCWSVGSHVLDEAERSLHDALCVLQQTVQDSRVIYGGGFPEMQMAKVQPPAPWSLPQQAQ